MAYKPQGLTENSFKNMWIDVGALFVNLNEVDGGIKGGEKPEKVAEILEKALADGHCLGATTGGATFSTNAEYRDIDADGKRFGFVGSSVIDSYDFTISTTVKEFTQENIDILLPTSEWDEATKSFKFRLSIDVNDYLDEVWLIGQRNDGALIGILLKNALNVSNATLTTTDKSEGTIEYEFRAHQGSFTDSQYAPCQIFFFTEDGVVEGASQAGASLKTSAAAATTTKSTAK